MKTQDRRYCESCYKTCSAEEVLRAPDPFNEGCEITACPHCRDVEHLTLVCDEPGCSRAVDCGFKEPGVGYRRTCSEHYCGK